MITPDPDGVVRIKPQPGPQTLFLNTPADIAIYGGAAYGGKSFALLLEGLRYCPSVPGFYGVIFRRTTTDIRNPGGLWDESLELYSLIPGAKATEGPLEWDFQKGGKLKFAHLEHENTIYSWHGSQVPFFGFDELTTFTSKQFWYMLSRNRSPTGIRPIIRATCNPDADSWVARLITWWIDPHTGYPIKERAGVVRWFLQGPNDKLLWADRSEDLIPEALALPRYDHEGREIAYQPKSFTFIPADIFDNKIGVAKTPDYLASLMAMPLVERERLLSGNWKIRPAAGLFFNRTWCEFIEPEALPTGLTFNRGYDLAGTKKTATNDPDATCGVKIGKSVDRVYYVTHAFQIWEDPGGVDQALLNTASMDGRSVHIHLPQDPAQAGKSQRAYHTRLLSGYPVHFKVVSGQGDKETRFTPFSAQAKAGNVKIVKGAWNEAWLSALEGFPDLKHDDYPDATAEAFNGFLDANDGLIEYYREEAARVQRAETLKREPPLPTATTGVKIKGPAGINMIYDRKGRPVLVDPLGEFLVDPEHAKALRKAGFTEVTKPNGKEEAHV